MKNLVRLAALVTLAEAVRHTSVREPVAIVGAPEELRTALHDRLRACGFDTPPEEAGIGEAQLSGAVALASSSSEAAYLVRQVRINPDAGLWVLWSDGSSAPVADAAGEVGLRVATLMTSIQGIPPRDLIDAPVAVAAKPRPWWSRVARRREPRAAAARAAFLVGNDVLTPWPAPLGAEEAPSVIHVSGGARLGRAVLTFETNGRPSVHVAVEPEPLGTSPTRHSAEVLRHLDALGVPWAPRVVETREVGSSFALMVTHLGGDSVAHGWRHSLAGWRSDVDAVVEWLAEVAEDAAPLVDSGTRLGRLPVSPDDPVLATLGLPGPAVAAVRRGLLRVRRRQVLVHGDLDPSNVVVLDEGAAAYDWGWAHIGHPLHDVVHFLVTSVRDRHGEFPGLVPAALQMFTRTGDHGQVGAEALSLLVPDVDPADLDDLVLSACVEIALSEPHGGLSDPHRRQEWAKVAVALWRAWAVDGSPWQPRVHLAI